jgi:hypothetical protein
MFITVRAKLNVALEARLKQNLETGLLEGFLELDISEIEDSDNSIYFRDARRLVRDEGLRILTKQVNILREVTSVIARLFALSSLTSRNSWPILTLTASIPLLDYTLGLIPWKRKYGDSNEGISSSEEMEYLLNLRVAYGSKFRRV